MTPYCRTRCLPAAHPRRAPPRPQPWIHQGNQNPSASGAQAQVQAQQPKGVGGGNRLTARPRRGVSANSANRCAINASPSRTLASAARFGYWPTAPPSRAQRSRGRCAGEAHVALGLAGGQRHDGAEAGGEQGRRVRVAQGRRDDRGVLAHAPVSPQAWRAEHTEQRSGMAGHRPRTQRARNHQRVRDDGKT